MSAKILNGETVILKKGTKVPAYFKHNMKDLGECEIKIDHHCQQPINIHFTFANGSGQASTYVVTEIETQKSFTLKLKEEDRDKMFTRVELDSNCDDVIGLTIECPIAN
ncbi:MAG: hypothetical protein ACXVPU_00150 [Bacteroidia bacterium]